MAIKGQAMTDFIAEFTHKPKEIAIEEMKDNNIGE